jgi:hypothetical protein
MLSTVGATPGCRGLTPPRPIRISAVFTMALHLLLLAGEARGFPAPHPAGAAPSIRT